MSPGYLLKSTLNRIVPSHFLVHRHASRENRLALTFDDGPHPVNTRKILDILDNLEVKATFFVQGSEAKKYPDLVRELLKHGHQIGNHGFNHLDCKKSGLGEYVADVEDTQKLLEDIAGTNLDRIFRPPYGNVTLRSFLNLSRLGYKYIFWSADSRDSYIREPDDLLRYVLALPLMSGDVLLFHEDYSHSIEIISNIVKSLKEKGFSFSLIDSFLKPDH